MCPPMQMPAKNEPIRRKTKTNFRYNLIFRPLKKKAEQESRDIAKTAASHLDKNHTKDGKYKHQYT
jgi:hypothetical protein